MRRDIPVISASETAFLLRAKLGPMRAWSNFLADNIRARQSVSGLTLLPCAQVSDGRGFRPWYAVTDVQEFIASVLELEPEAGRKPITPITISVEDALSWRSSANNFDERGSMVPVAATTPTAPGYSSFHGYPGILH